MDVTPEGPKDAFDPELLPGRLQNPADWPAIFGMPGPMVVEIGSGGGRFLLARAAAFPHTPFLGIEWAGKYFRLLRQRAAKRDLRNARVVRAEAAHFLNRYVGDSCVSELHIYFPDPWPKRRHLRRRLFGPDFVRDAHRVLIPGGRIFFASDFLAYFDEILKALRPAFSVIELPGPWPDAPGGLTNYEIKYVASGRPIRRAVAMKQQAALSSHESYKQ